LNGKNKDISKQMAKANTRELGKDVTPLETRTEVILPEEDPLSSSS